MILERLTVCDFRAYRGRHEVDLTPRVRYRRERPIVLFGGLNGAGKTTLMLAIKLALYGRHALGAGTPHNAYHQFLRESIHSPRVTSRPRDSTSVEIEFLHGKLGESTRYTVHRCWSVASGRVEEKLTVSQDGHALSLSPNAGQGFISELVPIGVSDLFFFDGEKIADLADDETGHALGDAIRRLLGLHHVERLRGDLRVYALRQGGDDHQQATEKIDRLQAEYEAILREIRAAEEELACTRKKLEALREEHDLLDLRLSELGGDWGMSRETLRNEATQLEDVLQATQRELYEQLSGIYPLALACEALKPGLNDAAKNLNALTHAEANSLLASFADKLKKQLGDREHKHVVDCLLKETLRPVSHSETLLDVSHRALGRMEQAVRQSIPDAQARVGRLVEIADDTRQKLGGVTLRMEQSPDEATLAEDMGTLAGLAEQINHIAADVAVRAREIKSQYWVAIAKARELRDQHAAVAKQQDTRQTLEYAQRARLMLSDFHHIKARRKIEELEHEFGAAFQELARKDDLVAKARIDQRNFTVKLLNHEGRELRQAQLSAGEKQIYAIAMLDALARTSGRRLPVVIDTPLGRLDSQHRSNLVTNYFPRASHQVILLSTDVEVDRSFYRGLSPHVSHAFEIRYDSMKGASSLVEGYFWRANARRAG